MVAVTVTTCPEPGSGAPYLTVTVAHPHDPSDSIQGTLGGVLYADRAKARPSEADWVRLVHSIAAQDQLALRELYERSHRLVFTLIMRIAGSRENAEELTLDVFHDVWRRAPDYDEAGGTVLGWIMNQARSRAIDRVRRERRKKRVNPYPTEQLAQEAPADAPELSEMEEQRRLLIAALSLLTPAERQAIETSYFSELTHAEVASRLGAPLGTIKTRIRSGLTKLRQAIARK